MCTTFDLIFSFNFVFVELAANIFSAQTLILIHTHMHRAVRMYA